MPPRNPYDNPDTLVAVLREVFTTSQNNDAENTVDALFSISRALQRLGNADANTSMGGLEALGAAILDGNGRIADALSAISDSLDNLAEAISAQSTKP